MEFERFFSKFWQKTWGKSVGTALYVARPAIRGKQIVLGRLIVCLLFSNFSRKFLVLGKEISACLSILHSIFDRKKLRKKVWTILSKFVFPDFRRQLFEIVANYSRETLSELPCKCPEESFGKKTEEIFFSLFLDGELKMFGPLAKKIVRFVNSGSRRRKVGMFVKTAFYLWQIKIEEEGLNNFVNVCFFGFSAAFFRNCS